MAEGCCRQQGAACGSSLEAPAHTAIGCLRGVWDARWLHCSAAGVWMKEPSAPGHCVSFEVDFIHALLTKHMQCLAHLVMLDVWVGQANDLIPKTAEDLGESSPFCLRVRSCKRLRRSIGLASTSTDPVLLSLILSVDQAGTVQDGRLFSALIHI